jgi:CBS domain containing-hemolysin-like protein
MRIVTGLLLICLAMLLAAAEPALVEARRRVRMNEGREQR